MNCICGDPTIIILNEHSRASSPRPTSPRVSNQRATSPSEQTGRNINTIKDRGWLVLYTLCGHDYKKIPNGYETYSRYSGAVTTHTHSHHQGRRGNTTRTLSKPQNKSHKEAHREFLGKPKQSTDKTTTLTNRTISSISAHVEFYDVNETSSAPAIPSYEEAISSK